MIALLPKFLAGTAVLLAGAVALLFTGAVKVKMLPFDNKREFQVQLDLPAGAAGFVSRTRPPGHEMAGLNIRSPVGLSWVARRRMNSASHQVKIR